MQIDIGPGKYVVAVSGGVDSMVLLDVLSKMNGVDVIVAHFEHGIREDADEDRKLVGAAAAHYGLAFVYERGHLGPDTSEATAREARYAFLRKVKKERKADAIITAHHQDDLLETAILNIMRGTGRKGLSSLRSTGDLLRPLLPVAKEEIVAYAQDHRIAWREDSTNRSKRYARNYVRQAIMPRLSRAARKKLLGFIEKAGQINPIIDRLLLVQLRTHMDEEGLDRNWFIMLPHNLSCEVITVWLRSYNIRQFDRKTIERLVVLSKTGKPGKIGDVNAEYLLKVSKTSLALSRRTAS
ncbi:MAG TPA: tRNA lysidine(34) synthetase TilS [Candidatus Saccharimonadales bacterium]|nr:tRNA lysidine(34) synthetase TilS [Candidatus Saccharimonadales bacterium]